MSSTDTPTEATDEAEAVAETDAVREAMLEQLTTEFGDALAGSHLEPGIDLTVRVDAAAWGDLAMFLKSGMGFGFFSWLSAIDWLPSPFGRDMDSQVDISLEAGTGDGAESADADGPANAGDSMESGLAGGDTRFQVFARVGDIVNHRGITVKADVGDDLTVPSWVEVYAGANWHEREAWEMFGISFAGHPGLRNLYLPGEFEGNPMRKDYPLLARRVKPWPGIVDVEAMPGDDDEDADDTTTAADPTNAGESNAGDAS